MLQEQRQVKTDKAKELLDRMLHSTKELVTALEQENKELETNNLSKSDILVVQKIDVITRFNRSQSNIASYHINGGIFDKKSSKLSKLRKLLVRLDEVSIRNEILLLSSLEINKILIEMYKEQKLNHTINQYGYSDKGSVPSEMINSSTPSVGFINKV